MLDVHPPHTPTHTWRDFFIHIATIVIGLLIAVGLEQTVEYLHHRHQIIETRDALHEARDQNRHKFAVATERWRGETIRFQTNLAVLLYVQRHPKAPPTEWPGQIIWHNSSPFFADAAWETAQHDNITELMPQAEVRADRLLYQALGVVTDDFRERIRVVGTARQYMVQDSDPSHLSPADLAEEVARARAALVAHYRAGSDMRNLNEIFPDFSPAPTTLELNDIMHEPRADAYLNLDHPSPAPAQKKPTLSAK